MSARRPRGMTLLEVVVALFVLAVGVTALQRLLAAGVHGIATDVRLTEATLLARGLLADAEVHPPDALARSGVAAAAVFLTGRDPDAVDWARAPWAEGSGRQPLGAGTVEVMIEDEARRLALGVPELADRLPRLLAVLGLDAALADALADWTDADDTPRPLGAERAYYLGLTPPYAPRNAPLGSVGELALVRGFTRPVVERLRPYVTVAREARVNPNTASREVLLAVVDDPAAVERLLAARARAAIDPEKDLPAILPGATPDAIDALRARLTARGTSYTVRAVSAVGDLTRAAEATLFAPPGVAAEVTAWRPFRP